jgi:hypothetical protein
MDIATLPDGPVSGMIPIVMPDPFLFIVGVIAIVCIVLFPLRIWRQKTRRYGNEDEDGGGEVPLAPPKRHDPD